MGVTFMTRMVLFFSALIAAHILAGCDTIGSALLGGGASAGVQAGISNMTNGTVSRTFTDPVLKVRLATLEALQHMQFEVSRADTLETGKTIKAKSANLNIKVELEEITPNATRVSVTTTSGVYPYDNATSTEILVQVKSALSHPEPVQGHLTP